MKKWIILILVFSMASTLVACGTKTDADKGDEPTSGAALTDTNQNVEPTTGEILTKEEMMAQAKEVSALDINNDSIDNMVKAKYNYCNQVLMLEGLISSFGEDHIEMSDVMSPQYIVDVYLPVEEMLDLEKGQSIVVVGMTTDEIIKTSAGGIFESEIIHYQMPVAYLVKDTTEIEVTLQGADDEFSPAFNCAIGSSGVSRLIFFRDGVDTSTFELGQKIKVSAKAVMTQRKVDILQHYYWEWEYRDAEIID